MQALYDTCNVTGFTTWSLLDDFEWSQEYSYDWNYFDKMLKNIYSFSISSEHFGMYHVNLDVEEKSRTPKASVAYMQNIIETDD